MRAIAQRLDFLADGPDLLFRSLRLHYNQHMNTSGLQV
jgi:hypothetical protein